MKQIQFNVALPQPINCYMASRLSLDRNKYSTHIIATVGADGGIYVIDAWREKASVADVADKQLALCNLYQPLECLIDDNASRVYVVALADRARSQKIRLNWKPLPMQGKETREACVQAMAQSSKLFFVPAKWNSWLSKDDVLLTLARRFFGKPHGEQSDFYQTTLKQSECGAAK